MPARAAVCLNQRELYRQLLGQTLTLFDKSSARSPGAAGIQRAPVARSALAELSVRASTPAELPASWTLRQYRRLAGRPPSGVRRMLTPQSQKVSR
jgi:hypothetical protein